MQSVGSLFAVLAGVCVSWGCGAEGPSDASGGASATTGGSIGAGAGRTGDGGSGAAPDGAGASAGFVDASAGAGNESSFGGAAASAGVTAIVDGAGGLGSVAGTGGTAQSAAGNMGMNTAGEANGGASSKATYTNPIITGNWSDAGVVRVGDYFYSTSSTFGWEPGLPIMRSADLIHWDYVGYAYLDNSKIPTGTVSGGAWGVEIAHNPNTQSTICYVPIDSRIYAYAANEPEGPYSGPYDTGISGIDPGVFADDDNRVYLIAASGSIWELESDGLKAKSTTPIVSNLSPNGGLFEGPEIIRRNDYYYINYSPGGTWTTQNSAISALRARNLTGPWTANPSNPLLNANTASNAAIQGPAHGELLAMPDGQWFITFHAYEQNWVSLGRSLSMEAVEWTNDNWWRPKNGRIPSTTPQAAPNLPPSNARPARSDEFANTTLGLQWFFHTHPDESGASWSLSERPGFLRIKTKGADVGSADSLSNVFLQRITLKRFDITTKVDFDASSGGEAAGILLYKDPATHLELSSSVCGSSKCFIVTKNGTTKAPVAMATNTIGSSVYLKISVDGQENATFFYGADGLTWTALGGTINFGKNGSPYIGWKRGEWSAGALGFFAVKNGAPGSKPADFDWFDHEDPTQAAH